MSDLAIRLAIVAAVVVVTVATGLVLRSGRLARRRRVALPGLGPGVVFFSGPGCASCDRVRSDLESVGAIFEEVGADDPRFPARVDRVPTVAVVGPAGDGLAISGVPSLRRLRALCGMAVSDTPGDP